MPRCLFCFGLCYQRFVAFYRGIRIRRHALQHGTAQKGLLVDEEKEIRVSPWMVPSFLAVSMALRTQFQHLFSSAPPSSASRLRDFMDQADVLGLANLLAYCSAGSDSLH
eukprot:1150314-Pelagomonas_calceolata.AAC.8